MAKQGGGIVRPGRRRGLPRPKPLWQPKPMFAVRQYIALHATRHCLIRHISAVVLKLLFESKMLWDAICLHRWKGSFASDRAVDLNLWLRWISTADSS